MKLPLLLLCIVGCMTVKGQTKMITHDMFAPRGVPYPFFDGHFVWWNDSTITYVSHYDNDSVRTLYQRVKFIMQDDLDTHRRLDSLIASMKKIEARPGHSIDEVKAENYQTIIGWFRPPLPITQTKK